MLSVDLRGKRALVTGANSGIGEAIARTLAEAGADVAINYVTHGDAAEAIAADLRTRGVRAMVVPADISDSGQVAAMFTTMIEAWGGIDILVNNAGIDGPAASAWDADLAGPFDPWRLPAFADIPAPGEPIEAGSPVLTVFASGFTPDGCRRQLQSRAAELDGLFGTSDPGAEGGGRCKVG